MAEPDWESCKLVAEALTEHAALGQDQVWRDPAGDVVGEPMALARVVVAALDLPARDARIRADAILPYENAITWGVPTVTQAQELDRLIEERAAGYREATDAIARAILVDAAADDRSGWTSDYASGVDAGT